LRRVALVVNKLLNPAGSAFIRGNSRPKDAGLAASSNGEIAHRELGGFLTRISANLAESRRIFLLLTTF
jgi:hypothetical protein